MIINAKKIREEVNIVDVVGEFVTLRRQGANHTGLCPFHNERTPSFHVFPHTGTFKCFGCGEGGDAIHFLMEHGKMTFPEALEKAASLSRMEVEYEDRARRQEELDAAKREDARRQELADCLTTVHRFLADKNPLSEISCDLDSRGIVVDADGRTLKKETVETFGICFSPDENVVNKSGFWDEPKLMELGIVAKGDYGNYDFFKNRLLFRITNHRGRPVGLGGRRRRADDAEGKRAKFINSKESVLYQKSEVLFGLYENRKGIREAEHAILVEGYMDVVTPHDFGVTNCVAPCGTALTEEQARLLKRYTEKVVILRDNDAAGFEAARRDVELLVRVGLQVSICLLGASPKLRAEVEKQRGWVAEKQAEIESEGETLSAKMLARQKNLLAEMEAKLAKQEAELAGFETTKDPDDFCRKHAGKGLRFFIEQNQQDAIIWRVMLEMQNADDIYQREAATNVAGSLLALIESQSLRDFYIREFCKKEMLGSVKTVLKDTVDSFQKNKGRKSELTPKQQQDIINYGIYEKERKYFVSTDTTGIGWACSNFTVKSIIFIEGIKASIRLVEITNDKNASRILDIDSKNFVELGPFKQTVEARGNFIFEGKPEHFSRVKRKVYDDMKTAFPINTLGSHKEGFMAFANGIIHEGRFHPVDEYGLVNFGETRYYLPAFSKIREHVKSDDVEQDYEDEKFYVFTPGEPDIQFKEWTRLMVEVHGENAVIAILYYLCTFIREQVYERLDMMFPHLNFFGMPGSGKNQLASSLIHLFGKYRQPVHIVNATDAAFFRRISQFRNGFAWYDEYSNNCDHKRVEALKQFADGTGRARANYDSSNRTNTSPVVSACIISGQQQPTADVALFTRCISLNFSKTEFSSEAQAKHSRLKNLEKSGKLTAYTAAIHALRPKMTEEFHEKFEAAFTRMKVLTAGQGIMDRIVRSYSAMLCAFGLLKDKLEFSFDEKTVEDILVRSISTQKEAIFSENEVSIWWRIVEFFISNGEIEHVADLIVEVQADESFDLGWSGGNKEVKQYVGGKRLVYVNFTRTHQFYMERHQRQRQAKGLDLEALKHYLKASPGFEGFKRSKKFGGVVKPCFVFDADKMPFELEDTIVVQARRRRSQPVEPEPDTEPGTNEPQKSFIPSQSIGTAPF